MNHNPWIDPRVSQVTAENVRAYLISRGWQLRTPARGNLLVFTGPLDDNGQPIELVLPAQERFRDFRMRVEDLVGALGVIEGRYAVLVLNDILAAHSTNGVPTSQQPKVSTDLLPP